MAAWGTLPFVQVYPAPPTPTAKDLRFSCTVPPIDSVKLKLAHRARPANASRVPVVVTKMAPTAGVSVKPEHKAASTDTGAFAKTRRLLQTKRVTGKTTTVMERWMKPSPSRIQPVNSKTALTKNWVQALSSLVKVGS